MARTFYRIYLYFVLTSLLNVAAWVTSLFVGDLIVRASGGDDTGFFLRQTGALASVSLLVVVVFGGLHYWLIRRDIAHDPEASKGPVRALFLNWNEAVAALVATVAGAIGFSALGPSGAGAAGAFGPALVFGILFLLLELERRRGQPERGGGIVLQRLHFALLQLILLSIAAGFTLYALGETVSQLIVSTGYAVDPCLAERAQYGYCSFSVGQYLGGAWLAALWVLAIWAGYGLLARGDHGSILRAVFRFLGLATAVGYALDGIGLGAHTLLRGLFGAPDLVPQASDPAAPFANAVIQFSFIPPLVFGLAIAAAYWLWLHADARPGGVMTPEAARQAILAVVAALAAPLFWLGWALTLGGIFERLVPQGNPPSAEIWAVDLAFVAAGAVYVPLAFWLSALARRTGVSVPRRGFVYLVLVAGTLGTTYSLIALLYALVANALGTPLPGWQQLARQGLAGFLVGALVVGIYVFIARREGWFTRQPTPSTEPAAVPSAETLEGVLDELTARRLTRDEAATRIRALSARGM